MATYFKRGAAWRAQVIVPSGRLSKTFSTKAEAIRWATAREAEASSNLAATANIVTLRKVMERYAEEESPQKKGEKWERLRLSMLARTMDFADKRLADVSANHLADWRQIRLKSVKPATVRREMILLNSVFEVARREWKLIATNPLKEVRKPPQSPARDRIYQPDEVKRIVERLGYFGGTPRIRKHEVAIAFMLAIETAMRSGEIYGLDWGRVRLRERYLTLATTKNGDSRDVPLSSRAVELLEAMPGREGRVFTVSKASADALFRVARDAAKVSGARFHDSRATALTALAKKLDLLDLARMVGHRDPRSLLIYYREPASAIAAKLG